MFKSVLGKMSLRNNNQKNQRKKHSLSEQQDFHVITPESYENNLHIPGRKVFRQPQSLPKSDDLSIIFCRGCCLLNNETSSKTLKRIKFRKTKSSIITYAYQYPSNIKNKKLLPKPFTFNEKTMVFSRSQSTPCLQEIEAELDGPFLHQIADCSCGECRHEFYTYGEEYGYGINIYGSKACTAVPTFCHDFAVVYCT